MEQATASAEPAEGAPPPAPAAEPDRPVRSRLGRDLVVLGIVGALLAAAIATGFAALQREFWGPSAFVERYLELLADGDAAGALGLPGVALDSTDLETAGLPLTAHDALLRGTVLTAPLTDIEVGGEHTVDGAVEVTATYRADGVAGRSVFRIVQDGTEGLVPRWGFETSPLAVLELVVRGSMQFDVNGFEIDKRQVSPDGAAADPLDPVALLAFSPGLYAVGVTTSTATSEPTRVLADAPMRATQLEIQAQPTEEFAHVVTTKVQEFLAQCTDQQVLQPTGCPFGTVLEEYRLLPGSLPDWSIVQEPQIDIVPDGAYWAISPATGTAHVRAEMVRIFDGVTEPLDVDVPFVIDGTIEILPDGTASILVGSPALR